MKAKQPMSMQDKINARMQQRAAGQQPDQEKTSLLNRLINWEDKQRRALSVSLEARALLKEERKEQGYRF